MEYISITETAEKWGISTRRVRTLCAADRVPGAQRVGACWVIPANAVKPADNRLKKEKGI